MTTMTFEQLQAEQAEWSMKNFGPKEKHQPLLGIIEELGELADAIGAMERTKTLDSVADIMIYAADFCTQWGWSLDDLYRSTQERPVNGFSWSASNLSHVQGRLAHHQLKWEQKIRSSEGHEESLRLHLCGIFQYLNLVCWFLGAELVEVVEDVWKEVRKRDWTKNPNNADKVIDGQAG